MCGWKHTKKEPPAKGGCNYNKVHDHIGYNLTQCLQEKDSVHVKKISSNADRFAAKHDIYFKSSFFISLLQLRQYHVS